MDLENSKKTYSNGEITIVWQPSVCIHSTVCWKGKESLSNVFNPKENPWIKVNEAPTELIIEQIKRCPSGALSFYFNNEKEDK